MNKDLIETITKLKSDLQEIRDTEKATAKREADSQDLRELRQEANKLEAEIVAKAVQVKLKKETAEKAAADKK